MTDYDSSNPRHIKLAQKSAKAIADSKSGFINHIMGLVDGRTFIHDLLASCGVFEQTVFTGDALTTAFNCGRHSIGQQLVDDIMRVCPDDFVKMKREANARNASDDARRSRSDADANGDDRGPGPYVHPAFDGQGNDRSSTTESEYNPFRDEGGEG